MFRPLTDARSKVTALKEQRDGIVTNLRSTLASKSTTETRAAEMRQERKARLSADQSSLDAPSLIDIAEVDERAGLLEESAERLREEIRSVDQLISAAETDFALRVHDEYDVNFRVRKEEFLKVSEDFGTKLVDLLAAHRAMYVDYPDPTKRTRNFPTSDSMYGDLAPLARCLGEFKWPDDYRPSWAPRYPAADQQGKPLPGVAAALKQIPHRIEETYRSEDA